MSIFSSFWNFVTGKRNSIEEPYSSVYNDPISLYAALDNLYHNDASFIANDTTRRLRTVVNRSVEFFVAKTLPGDGITVTANSPQIQEAIESILKRSNFAGKKPALVRDFALYGDSFIRVRGEEDKVIQEGIKPYYVTDFTEDSRGFVTSLRIDIPTWNDFGAAITFTEFWDLYGLRTWEGYHSRNSGLDTLGTPLTITPLSEMGIDFIPVTHVKFRDTGSPRGTSCVFHALDKILEANRLATRLNDMQFRFNKPIWAALANGMDKEGRPLPAPRIKTSGSGANANTEENEKESIFGDVAYMPGASDMKPLIPGVNYADALAILNSQMEEIEKDLPELRYYSLNENQLSGKAIERLLAGAIDRANEAKNNMLSGLKRANEMSITIGQYMGLFPASLGTFDSGSFEHSLAVDAMFSETLDERATTLKTLKDGGVPLALAMKVTGWSEEQIAEAKTELGNAPKPEPVAT